VWRWISPFVKLIKTEIHALSERGGGQ